MQDKTELILTVPPHLLPKIRGTPFTPAHMAYRLGPGCHLYRTGSPVPLRSGLMVLDSNGFDSRGDPAVFCREVMQECAARQFSGVLCDFEAGTSPALGQIAQRLGTMCESHGLSCYLPEFLGRFSQTARVLLSTAISGGTLQQRLAEAADQFGSHRVVPAVERVCMDFYLPSPSGQGREMSREDLLRCMEEKGPSVFFSRELCAHYFTYMSRENGAHFVLFDDGASIRQKLDLAKQMGFPAAVLAFPQVEDLLSRIME